MLLHWLLASITGDSQLHLVARAGNEDAGIFLAERGAQCNISNNKVSRNKVRSLSFDQLLAHENAGPNSTCIDVMQFCCLETAD